MNRKIFKMENLVALAAGITIPAGLFMILRVNDWYWGGVLLVLGFANLIQMFRLQRREYLSKRGKK